ncbi:MAG: zf-HC2 domain-containing protein [Candidatus Omnitrophota bacterium]
MTGTDKDHISCKIATVLMSKSMEEELSAKEKAMLTAHLAVCRTCVYCSKQLKSLRETLKHYMEAVCSHEPPSDCCLSEKACQRIKDKLTGRDSK